MSSAQSPAVPKPTVRRAGAPSPRPALGASGGRRVDVGALVEDLRCGCGRLLAKVVPGGLEIRCTRCKASHVLAWRDVEGARAFLGDTVVDGADAPRGDTPP